MSITSVTDIVTILKKNVDTKGLIDISSGVEKKFGVTQARFRLAVNALIKDEDYQVYLRVFEQVGTDKKTAIKVLGSSESKYKDVYDQTIHPVEID